MAMPMVAAAVTPAAMLSTRHKATKPCRCQTSAFHEVTQSTNALGQVSSNTYDSSTGLITSSTDPLGFVTSYVWSSGRMQSQTDPLGHISLYRYDGDLRQTAVIDALGNWSQTAYADGMD
jgi:YD repeat-containing protein